MKLVLIYLHVCQYTYKRYTYFTHGACFLYIYAEVYKNLNICVTCNF